MRNIKKVVITLDVHHTDDFSESKLNKDLADYFNRENNLTARVVAGSQDKDDVVQPYSYDWKFANVDGKIIDNPPEIIQSIKNLQSRIQGLILYTPTGSERNKLTEENIALLHLMDTLEITV